MTQDQHTHLLRKVGPRKEPWVQIQKTCIWVRQEGTREARYPLRLNDPFCEMRIIISASQKYCEARMRPVPTKVLSETCRAA